MPVTEPRAPGDGARRRRSTMRPAHRAPRSGLARPGAFAGLLAVALGLLAATAPVDAQQGPIRLFPDQPAPTTAPSTTTAPQSRPEARAGETAPLPRTVDRGPVAPLTGTSAPEAPQGFQIEGLAAPAIDAIGLSGPAEGGFERILWQGSDPNLVLTLLATLPVVTANPALRDLTRRVLATGAPLEGATPPGRALQLRIERLLALGALDEAAAMLAQLPPAIADSDLVRLAVETALLTGADDEACRRAADVAPTSADPFWAEVTILCRLVAGDEAGARLAIDLLRDRGQAGDGDFLQLASLVAEGEAPVVPAGPSQPSAVDLALLRQAGQPLPPALLPRLTPPLLGAVARDPILAGEHRLEAAERAYLAGGLSAEALVRTYAELAPPADGDPIALIRTDWGPRTRAAVYRALVTDGPVEAKADLLEAAWRAADGAERFLVATGYAFPFVDLPIERALLPAGPASARALLATRRPVPAARWYALLDAEAGRDGAARREVAALTPLFALAGFGGSDAVPRLDMAAIADWQAGLDDPGDVDARTERLLALLDGVGAPVPAAAWRALTVPPLREQAEVPTVAVWRGLEQAVAGRRLGESILFVLQVLDGAGGSVHPEALVVGLGALAEVGLDREARAIAVDEALGAGL